jgi:hypothetical protein
MMARALGVLATLAILGTVPVGLAIALNLRDRRRDRLLGAITPELARIPGGVGGWVRCAAFWRRSTVRLDTWLCTPREMWDTSLRVLEHLPPGVRLVVHGPVSEALVATVTLVAHRRADPGEPGRPAPARLRTQARTATPRDDSPGPGAAPCDRPR